MTTITWVVTKMLCYPTIDNETDVVFQVYFDVRGVDGEFDSCVQGTANLQYAPSQQFIPFDQLTNDLVITWVKAEIGNATVRELEYAVTQRIVDQQSPPIVTPQLPWN